MPYKIHKIVFSYKEYSDFLSFELEGDSFLKIKGFFGVYDLFIPKNILLEIDDKSIIFFFYSKNFSLLKKNIKSLCHNFIFGCHVAAYAVSRGLSIRGIGYRFQVSIDENSGNKKLIVFSGNALPTEFILPKDIIILDNGNFTDFTVIAGNYFLLNEFLSNIQRIAKPNKYKEIGIFLDKEL